MVKTKEKITKGTLQNTLQYIVGEAYEACGYDENFAQVVRSKLPEMAHYQSNGAFSAAKEYGVPPLDVAKKVAEQLGNNEMFSKVSVAEPGFVNMFLSDDFLVKTARETLSLDRRAETEKSEQKKVILDYGGANVAKPLHVGHLRSAIIGESIKKIGRFLGHEVIGDIHLGDWGLQMGMIIVELKERHPELPYFDSNYKGKYPKESPVTIEDLDVLYPEASKKAKDDEKVMEQARQATVELQNGHPGYRALWEHFVSVSVSDLKSDYSNLGVEFDLWLGESDANETVGPLLEKLTKDGVVVKSDGALIMPVGKEDDVKEMPPLLLCNSDGAALYGATDLATIKQRVEKYDPDEILYVVDKRQALHLEQVFRGARKTGIVNETTNLEHIAFGTMNGTDNKPFKTREGGTMKLKELTSLIIENARKRLKEVAESNEYSSEEKEEIARMVGIATLKFADLSNHRTKDYVFDLERFSSFEGYTGPYLQYSAVRADSILKKASDKSFVPGELIVPKTDSERNLILKLLEFRQLVFESWTNRAPSDLCGYVYDLATVFNSFYHECPVLNESDSKRQASHLFLVESTHNTIVQSLNLLGIEVPERM